MKWNNRTLKKELQAIYQAPEPLKKKAFLQSLQPITPSITLSRFIWEQLWYIRKWVWFVSGALFVLFIFVSTYFEENAVSIISFLLPYLALMILTETSRSRMYAMEELEMTTRFSLKTVWLAQMGALGILHTLLLSVLMLYLKSLQPLMLHSICHILIPYFLTISSGIYLFRQPRNKNVSSLAFALPPLVSAVVCISRACFPFLYTIQWSGLWIIFFFLLLILTLKESYLYYKQISILT